MASPDEFSPVMRSRLCPPLNKCKLGRMQPLLLTRNHFFFLIWGIYLKKCPWKCKAVGSAVVWVWCEFWESVKPWPGRKICQAAYRHFESRHPSTDGFIMYRDERHAAGRGRGCGCGDAVRRSLDVWDKERAAAIIVIIIESAGV